MYFYVHVQLAECAYIMTTCYLRASAVIATATCLGGWLAVTLRYYIKTAKPI